jgi:hypothetical protein
LTVEYWPLETRAEKDRATNTAKRRVAGKPKKEEFFMIVISF